MLITMLFNLAKLSKQYQQPKLYVSKLTNTYGQHIKFFIERNNNDLILAS
jgi:hypothetical protein